jgi:hypothetical protein
MASSQLAGLSYASSPNLLTIGGIGLADISHQVLALLVHQREQAQQPLLGDAGLSFTRLANLLGSSTSQGLTNDNLSWPYLQYPLSNLLSTIAISHLEDFERQKIYELDREKKRLKDLE